MVTRNGYAGASPDLPTGNANELMQCGGDDTASPLIRI
jgi:hypothetical protein